jgi:hypothetical protein
MKLYVSKYSGKITLQKNIVLKEFVLGSYKRGLTTVLSEGETRINTELLIV